MRPEDLTVVLRPRPPWEAADLGCALTRRDLGSVLALWSVSVLPLWALVAGLMHAHPAAFTLVVWWLKPLYDRVTLLVLSRSAFGARTGWRQGLRALPGLWMRFLLPSLLWRRLSPARSFVLPIWMLEGQRGKHLRQRATVLASEGGSSGATLTWVFIKLEIAVFLGLLVLTSAFAPDSGFESTEEFVGSIEDGEFTLPAAWYWWYNLCYLAAVAIVEPFYVGAGFGLYLNCRAKLEGWDVELAFRKTAARLQKSALTTAVLLLTLLAPIAALAAAPEAPANGNDLARQILAEPDFEIQKRTQREWVPEPMNVDGSVAATVMQVLQFAGYLLLALLLIALIVWLVRAALRLRAPVRLQSVRPAAPPAATLVMGLSITPESLPADLLASARAAWSQGAAREALSLLYRGALSLLVERRHLPIASSDTEDDCEQRVRQAEDGRLAGYFSRLTRLWTRVAYAGQAPSASEFEALCHEWPFASLERLPVPSPARPLLLPAGLALLLVATLTGCNGRWVEEERELGLRGKARIDPFLAAQRFLQQRGHHTERRPSLIDLPSAPSGLVFTSAENGLPTGRARPLLEWVHAGGHLIYALTGTTPYNDWTTPDLLVSYPVPEEGERQDPILEALAVRLRHAQGSDAKTDAATPADEAAPKTKEGKLRERLDVLAALPELVEAKVEHRGKPLTVELPEEPVFALDRPLRRSEFQALHEGDALLLSLRHGSGRVTLLNHARLLRNRHLADHDHGRLLDLLLDRKQPLQALFVVGLEGSFSALLWERAWRVLIGLAVLLLVWLWATLPRFGPVRPALLHPVRRFADHLETLGHFFYRTQRHPHLLASAQSALRRRLRETHPHLTHPADQERFLAERTGLPVERIATALAEPDTLPAKDLIRLLQDLQTLRHRLS